MVLVYHVISQENMMKWSCDLMGEMSSRQVTTLQSLATLVVEL